MTTILEWLWKVVPVILGGAGAYLFCRFIGCRSGSCPITGSPWLSTIYGAVLDSCLRHSDKAWAVGGGYVLPYPVPSYCCDISDLTLELL